MWGCYVHFLEGLGVEVTVCRGGCRSTRGLGGLVCGCYGCGGVSSIMSICRGNSSLLSSGGGCILAFLSLRGDSKGTAVRGLGCGRAKRVVVATDSYHLTTSTFQVGTCDFLLGPFRGGQLFRVLRGFFGAIVDADLLLVGGYCRAFYIEIYSVLCLRTGGGRYVVRLASGDVCYGGAVTGIFSILPRFSFLGVGHTFVIGSGRVVDFGDRGIILSGGRSLRPDQRFCADFGASCVQVGGPGVPWGWDSSGRRLCFWSQDLVILRFLLVWAL